MHKSIENRAQTRPNFFKILHIILVGEEIPQSMKGCLSTKVCQKCKRELPIECFPVDQKSKDGVSSQCKDCRAEYYRQHYVETKRTVDTHKTHCAKCHCAEPYVLTFHHIDYKTKSFDISTARRKLSAVLAELEKCICLCYNCHHTYHYFYGMRPDDPHGSLQTFLDPEWTPPKHNNKTEVG